MIHAHLPAYFIAGSLALMTAVANAGPKLAPKAKTQTAEQRLSEIDRELAQNREKIATAIKVFKTLPCGTGVLESIEQVRKDRQQLEELRRKGVPAHEIAALAERVRQGGERLEKWRAELERPTVLNIETLNEDIAALKMRNVELEEERAALVKSASRVR